MRLRGAGFVVTRVITAAGTYAPIVGDGIYIMLAPLAAGEHTVHFHGRLPDFGNFTLDILYHLTVGS